MAQNEDSPERNVAVEGAVNGKRGIKALGFLL